MYILARADLGIKLGEGVRRMLKLSNEESNNSQDQSEQVVDGRSSIDRDLVLYPKLRKKDRVENFANRVKRKEFNLT